VTKDREKFSQPNCYFIKAFPAVSLVTQPFLTAIKKGKDREKGMKFHHRIIDL